jgi:hypothetical protein
LVVGVVNGIEGAVGGVGVADSGGGPGQSFQEQCPHERVAANNHATEQPSPHGEKAQNHTP